MPIWNTASVDQDPQIVLRSWSIRQLSDGSRHFVGYNFRDWEGRASSRIVEFDAEKMRGKTRSGRVYELIGEPGHNPDAEYVWSAWCRINQVDPDTVVIVSLEELNSTPANTEAPKAV